MAKPKLSTWERKHLANISGYQRQIDRLYDDVLKEAARLGASLEIKGDSLFSFDDYPALRKRVERLFSGLNSRMYGVIVNGIEAEWTLANNKNSELARQVFGSSVGKLSQAQYRRYFSTNDNAREAFINRQEAGLKLSDRVWRYTGQFKREIELGLDVGIRNGMSAADMTAELRGWLREPDRLFRRVRDEHGELQLSKNAAAYHPGQGVYRSSYKNARRLAATETNIAYRTADYQRWQQLDFVVGIEIKLSNNHTLNDEPFEDICDELKGRYPKDFKFTGWHPHCRCHAVTILKTQEEIETDTKKLLNGEPIDGESVNRVDDVPEAFKEWLQDNAERSERTYSKPYFVTDNEKYIPQQLRDAYGSKLPYPTYDEYEQAMKYNRQHAGFSDEQLKNIKELNSVLPVIQGQIMPFGAADSSHPNPKFSIPNANNLGFHHNCQTCTVAYELRRRGFDIEAMANPVYGVTAQGLKIREVDVFYASHKMSFEQRFFAADGTDLKPSKAFGLADTNEAKRLFIEGHTATKGRYEVYCQWKKGSAHVFIVERQTNGNLLWYDPQSGQKAEEFAERYLKNMNPSGIWVTRIDDAIINPEFAKRLIKSGT